VRLRLPPGWAALLAVLADAAVSGWRTASHVAGARAGFFFIGLLWPGLLIFAAVYLFAWLGWALDID
jgi:hypothetical protein